MSKVLKSKYIVDEAFCDSQVTPFKNAFRGGIGKEITFQRGKFNLRKYATKSMEGCFTRKGQDDNGAPTITTIIDCSGSMSGDPIENAIQLAAVLSRLHRQKLIKANVILTGYDGSHYKKGIKYNGFKVPMPQPDWVWSHLNARHGAEGISQTFRMFMDDIKKSALVTCYTDANIVDEKLEPSLWRRHGVQCIGLYVGGLDQLAVMDRYFDRSIVRTNREDLFTSYLGCVRQMINRKKVG